jgi:hypothetical protein
MFTDVSEELTTYIINARTHHPDAGGSRFL